MKRRRSTREWYVGIAGGFWRNKALNLKRKGIIACLATFANHKLTCFPTVKQLMEITSMCEKTLYYHLRAIQDAGFIRIEDWRDHKGRERHLFTLLAPCQIYLMGYGKTTVTLLQDELRREISVQTPEGKPPPNVTPFPSPDTLPPSESDAPPPKPHRKEPVTREQRT